MFKFFTNYANEDITIEIYNFNDTLIYTFNDTINNINGIYNINIDTYTLVDNDYYLFLKLLNTNDVIASINFTVKNSKVYTNIQNDIFNNIIEDNKTYEDLEKLKNAVLIGQCQQVSNTVTFKSLDNTQSKVIAQTDQNGNRLSLIYNV